MEIQTGLRSILKLPQMYNLLGKLITKSDSERNFLSEFVLSDRPVKILDGGCGTATILDNLPHDIQYVGVDLSEKYIEAAKLRYPEKGTFFCTSLLDISKLNLGNFDCIILKGLIHHLNDDECFALFKELKNHLSPKGKIVTFDGVFLDKQNPISKWILSHDRGRNVRTEKEYLKLINKSFSKYKVNLKNNYLRIPYDHIIITLYNRDDEL